MALPIRKILDLLAENIRRAGLPIPISNKFIYQWAEPLDIPHGGETVLYTGALYQLMPYTKALVSLLEDLEGKKGAGLLLKVAGKIGKVIDLSGITSRLAKKDAEFYQEALSVIAKLLSRAEVNYGYLYEQDMYSGALLYDLGLLNDFAKHAQKVYAQIKGAGVRKIITVDPHTLYMLRTVFPKYIEEYNLEVVSYLEVLSGKMPFFKGGLKGEEVVLHDPCLYARFQAVVDQPRELISTAGFKVKEPQWSREMTFCCGGLMESIAPKLAKYIASERMNQLREKGKRVVTMCPICHVNLSRVAPSDVEVYDLAFLFKDIVG
ncbi:MAG: (Fe-S)-binding protein [Deltaproteobacteria bacterium]|nr:MAG: (Fe-S)-binding protein [Deltaproteobacteria bacterium]